MFASQSSVLSTQSSKPTTLPNSHLDTYSSDAPSPFAPEPDSPPPQSFPLPHLLENPQPAPSLSLPLSPTPRHTPNPAPSLPQNSPAAPRPTLETQNPKLETTPIPTRLPHSAFTIPHSRTSRNSKPETRNSLLPLGHLTLLLGEPGTGKSLLALDLAARLSRGLPLPFKNPPSSLNPINPLNSFNPLTPSTSLILSLEDSPSTIQSRLLAARADLVHTLLLSEPLDLVPPYDGLPKSWLHLDEQRSTDSSLIEKLKQLLPDLPNFRLLILDPLPAFLGTYDCSHQASIRKLLRPLIRLAEEHHFAILGISHLSKSLTKKDHLHRALGSTAYVALARSVLLLTYDDQAPNKNPDRRILIPLKHNFGKKACAHAFTITNPTLSTQPSVLSTQCFEDEELSASIQWDETPITKHPLLTQSTTILSPTNPFEESRRELAQRFLKTVLANGPMPSRELIKQANALGISLSTFDRARNEMNLNIDHDGRTGKWFISLPTPATTDN